MSLVNFQIAKKGDLTEEDRNTLVKIADIIEKGIDELDKEDRKTFLYHRKAVVPHIDEIKSNMRKKQELISQKVA